MGKQWKQCQTLFWGGSKITADGDCSHEIKRCLLLGGKFMTNPDSILKSRDITLPTNVHLVKAMVFPVVIHGCESWTIKKAERWRWCFELWCLRRLLRVPWIARRCNQSIPKDIILGVHWKDWCWSWNSNTSATWCEELTHWKDPDPGKDWRQEKKGTTEDKMVDWHHQLNGHGFEYTPGSWWWTERPGLLQSMGSQRKGHDWVTELNWTDLSCC